MKENLLSCAYGTFFMKNDAFLPGVLTLAFALEQMGEPYGKVCLVTPEISARARGALDLLYDAVIEVEQIRLRRMVTGGRQDREQLMTRFQALRLGPDGDLPVRCHKLILLDADMLPLSGFGGLFSLPAPAGVLQEKKEYCLRLDPNGRPDRSTDAQGRWCWHERYDPICPHGAPIPCEITNRVAHDVQNLGVNAALWRLDPSMEEYRRVLAALGDEKLLELIRRFPWPEMQLATLLWSGRWHNVDARYCAIGGYPRLDVLKGVHYAGLKPGQINNKSILHYARYPDFKLWYQTYLAMLYTYPALLDYPALKRLEQFILRHRLL